MSDISKINVGGTEYNIKDATARTEIQPISRGGTGATTASGALSNLGAAEANVTPRLKTIESAPTDLLQINTNGDYSPSYMQTTQIDADASTLINCPVASGYFVATRDVYQHSFPQTLVVLREFYPNQGRVWTNFYNASARYWDGWKSTFVNGSDEIFIGQIRPNTGYYASHIFEYGGTGVWSQMRPQFDSSCKIGSPSYRYGYMHCVNYLNTSDRRLKENISDDFTKLANVFAKLRPVTFEFADMKDDITRIGFIAQEIEEVMAEEGLNASDFAFMRKDTIDEDSEMAKFIGDTTVYSLNYSEFIALNTYMIQSLQKENDELRRRLDAIEERLEIS